MEVRVLLPDLKGRNDILEYYVSKIKKDSGFRFCLFSITRVDFCSDVCILFCYFPSHIYYDSF